jgi:hypothetical protein
VPEAGDEAEAEGRQRPLKRQRQERSRGGRAAEALEATEAGDEEEAEERQRPIPDPGSRVPDPKTAGKERDEKN